MSEITTSAKEDKKLFDWALLIGVIVVIIGHVIGQIITDNYYFNGWTPVKKQTALVPPNAVPVVMI